jgi:hypothetical protein
MKTLQTLTCCWVFLLILVASIKVGRLGAALRCASQARRVLAAVPAGVGNWGSVPAAVLVLAVRSSPAA